MFLKDRQPHSDIQTEADIRQIGTNLHIQTEADVQQTVIRLQYTS